MRPLLLFAFLLGPLLGKAQLMDSIRLFLQEEPRPVVKLDVRGSFVSNRSVRMLGVKVGLEHARRFQYGIGYSMLFTAVERERMIAGGELVTTRLNLGFVTPYVDYAFYQRGPWEVRLPVQLGIGGGSVTYRDAAGRRQRLDRSVIILYEPAMTVQYRFLKYFAVGGGWGFRLAFHTRSSLGEDLSAPIYSFGLRIFFADLWRDQGPQAE